MATAFGVKLTAQLVETAPVVGLVLALPSVQLEAEKDPQRIRLTSIHSRTLAEPVGVSVTVAVQLVALPTGTEAGMQLTPVVVACVSAVTTVFFFNDTATTEIYTLSLHDALPISFGVKLTAQLVETAPVVGLVLALPSVQLEAEKVPPLFAKLTVPVGADRKTTRLNSSHSQKSYAVFCLTKNGVQLTLVAVECLVAV